MLPPILLLIYNRPEHTRTVLKRLKDLGVQTLYVSADGARDKMDAVNCEAARHACLESGMTTETHFSQEHLGCRRGVISGLNWFFGLHKEGIVLEDDCLPNAAFLKFCQMLLDRYRHDRSVYMISGNNPLGRWHTGHGHHFARIGHIWGWATWSDRWSDFDPALPNLVQFADHEGFVRTFGNIALAQKLNHDLMQAMDGKVDTWDIQWTMHHVMKGRLAAIPSENMVSNIGFDSSATHTDERPDWLSEHVSEEAPEAGVPNIRPDRAYEMQLHIAKTLNRPSEPSPEHFRLMGLGSSKRLRIALLNTTDAGGGAEAIVMHLTRSLRSLGHQVSLLVQEKQTDDTGVVQLGNDPVAQITGLRPDVLHIHNLHGTGLHLKDVAKLAENFPALWTLHDAWLTTGSTHHPFILDSDTLSFLDKVQWNNILFQRNSHLKSESITFTAPSQWMCDRMLNTHRKAVHYVANCPLLPTPAEMEMPAREYILCVANHAKRNPYREHDVLLAAWEMANRSLGTDGIDLICIGGSPEERIIGNATYRMLGRQPTDLVLAYMQQAVAVIQASRQDNAPLTILEAHHVGTPVIGSMVGGIPEMLCPEETALLYKAGDAAALADSIVRVRSARQMLRDAVRSYFPEIEEEDSMAQTYLGHYLKAMKRG
jgi:glycosyltransferase involved in cell wall biosynthesis